MTMGIKNIEFQCAHSNQHLTTKKSDFLSGYKARARTWSALLEFLSNAEENLCLALVRNLLM